MELTGQFEQALKNYDEMLTTARERKDRRMELDAQMAASTLYSTPTAVMDAEKGQALSEETLKLAQELGDQSIECRVLWNLLLANLHGSKSRPGHRLRGEILESGAFLEPARTDPLHAHRPGPGLQHFVQVRRRLKRG